MTGFYAPMLGKAPKVLCVIEAEIGEDGESMKILAPPEAVDAYPDGARLLSYIEGRPLWFATDGPARLLSAEDYDLLLCSDWLRAAGYSGDGAEIVTLHNGATTTGKQAWDLYHELWLSWRNDGGVLAIRIWQMVYRNAGDGIAVDVRTSKAFPASFLDEIGYLKPGMASLLHNYFNSVVGGLQSPLVPKQQG